MTWQVFPPTHMLDVAWEPEQHDYYDLSDWEDVDDEDDEENGEYEASTTTTCWEL